MPGNRDYPTLQLIENMRAIVSALDSSFNLLLDVSMRFAEEGRHGDALELVEIVQDLQAVEVTVRLHAAEAELGMITRAGLH